MEQFRKIEPVPRMREVHDERDSQIRDAMFEAYWKANGVFPQSLFAAAGSIEMSHAALEVSEGDPLDAIEQAKITDEQIDFALSQMEKMHSKHGVAVSLPVEKIKESLVGVFEAGVSIIHMQRGWIKRTLSDQDERAWYASSDGGEYGPLPSDPNGTTVEDDELILWREFAAIAHTALHSKTVKEQANTYRRLVGKRSTREELDQVDAAFEHELIQACVQEYVKKYPDADYKEVEEDFSSFIRSPNN